MEGHGHKPRDAWSHQKLEEAGRTLPSSLRREPGLADTLILDVWPQSGKRMNVCCWEPRGEQSFPAGPRGRHRAAAGVRLRLLFTVRGSRKGPHHTCAQAASGLWVPRATGSPRAGVKVVAVHTPCGGRCPAAQEARRAWCPRVALSKRPPQAPRLAFKPGLLCFLRDSAALKQQLEAVCMFVLLVHRPHSRHSWPAPRGGFHRNS